MTIAHPIARAWLSTGGPAGRTTGSQNYDEFADDAEITAIIEANPTSALGVEMPHLAPQSVGTTFAGALPAAARRLADAQAEGRYRAGSGLAVLYRISGGGHDPAYGLWCMVDTDQISTSADEPGLVIRNEDVFVEKVRERVALAEATGHLLSPVLLLQTARGGDLHAALAAAAAEAGEPACVDVDQAGRRHEIWPLGPGALQQRLLELAGSGELVVADGNHRSLAAQTAGLRRFLAVVTTPASVTIQPYNRVVRDVDPAGLADRLRAAGADVEPLGAPVATPVAGGVVHLYTREGGLAVRLPGTAGGTVVDNLDHALVERLLLGGALGLEPGDKRITYVGGDYPADWLTGEVDAGRADLAVLIAPVTVEDFVAVNLARLKMPRKSTWFTPKARAGLVLADLSGPG
jgi:uncharacterized protein (DUF1015 family)